MLYKCECCGYYTLPEESAGNYNICLVCGWEDVIVQLENPTFEGGANNESLNQARKNYHVLGAYSRRFIDEVRKPFYEKLPESNTLKNQITRKLESV